MALINLNQLLQDISKFEENYRILKLMYKLLCVYNLNDDFKIKISDYFQLNRPININLAYDSFKQSKLEAIFSAIGLENLYLLNNRPTCSFTKKQQLQKDIIVFKQLIDLTKELLIDNEFNINAYKSSFIQHFSKKLFPIIAENLLYITDSSFTLDDRIDLIKIFSFIEVDEDIFNMHMMAIREEINNNLDSKQYLEYFLKPLVISAIEYNHLKLAQIVNCLITTENVKVIPNIIIWIEENSNINNTKLWLLTQLADLRYDYDNYNHYEQDLKDLSSMRVATKTLDRSFFDKQSRCSSKRSLSNNISQSIKSTKKSKKDTATISSSSLFTYTDKTNDTPQPCTVSNRAQLFHYPDSNSIRMFGGTLQISGKKRKSISMQTQIHVVTDHPIGLITDYYPDFTIPEDFVRQLSTNTIGYIAHSRGSHFYLDNSTQKEYYMVTDSDKIMDIQSKISQKLLNDLSSPVVLDLNTADASTIVLDTLQRLSESPHTGYPSKLHYMQEVYSNTFDRFHRTLKQNDVFSEYPYTKHPFVSFGDDIDHAARYGFGQKITGNRLEDRCRPVYYADGSLDRMLVGELLITLQTWERYQASHKFNVLSEFAKGNMSIHDRIINERETSFWATVSHEIIALRLPLIVPSFYKEYPPEYEQAFGINKAQYNNFVSELASKNQLIVINKIINHVINHYKITILANLQKTMKKIHSKLVYHGLDYLPMETLPSINAARILHIYNIHQKKCVSQQRVHLEYHEGTNPQNSMDFLHLPAQEAVQVESQKSINKIRCLRLLMTTMELDASTHLKINTEIILELRRYSHTYTNHELVELLDFVEQKENREAIISLFRKEEETHFKEARRILTSHQHTIKLIFDRAQDIIELFLVHLKQNIKANTIFYNIIILAKMLQKRFIFFNNEFKQMLARLFADYTDKIVELMSLLAKKIEDYNLIDNAQTKHENSTAPGVIPSSVSQIRTTSQINLIDIYDDLIEIIGNTQQHGKEKLKLALEQADYNCVKKYICLADTNLDEHNNSLLHLAVSTGNYNIVQEVLSKNGNNNEENDKKLTPVHLACYASNIDIFKLIYNKRVTLNVSHLFEILKNPASSDTNKTAMIALIFEFGIGLNENELSALILQATESSKKLLQYIKTLFITIDRYINQVTTKIREPLLQNDIYEVAHAMQSKISYDLLRIIIKRQRFAVYNNLHLDHEFSYDYQASCSSNLLFRTHRSRGKTQDDYNSNNPGFDLIRLIKKSHRYLSNTAIKTIITTLYQDIFDRGRINVVIATVILGDIELIQEMIKLGVDFSLTPNHGKTVNGKSIRKPIHFAIQYARSNIFSKILCAYDTLKNKDELLDELNRYKKDCEDLLELFSQNASLKIKYARYYEEIEKYLQEIIEIQTVFDVDNSPICELALQFDAEESITEMRSFCE